MPGSTRFFGPDQPMPPFRYLSGPSFSVQNTGSVTILGSHSFSSAWWPSVSPSCTGLPGSAANPSDGSGDRTCDEGGRIGPMTDVEGDQRHPPATQIKEI